MKTMLIKVVGGLMISVVAVVAVSVHSGTASSAAASTAPSFITANDCVEHQAFVDGDPAAVASRLPRGYTAATDPGSGRPLVFARAEHCSVAIGGESFPATLASFGIVINSPDGLGCSSGAPAAGQVYGQVPPVCNWYPLFWLADDERVVDWLHANSPGVSAVLAPGMLFQAGTTSFSGQTPFQFAAPGDGPTAFAMDDVPHPQSQTLSVRGGYWSGSGASAVKLAFSTDDLAPGEASNGTVHAPSGSELAQLMGSQQASYLPQYSSVGAEHWAHGSYRKQLLAPAPDTDSFAGSCSVQGTDTFTPPATNTAQDLHVTYDATGTCSGKLNGRGVTNAAVRWHSAAHSYGSCQQANTVEPASATITFADGTTIRATFDFTTGGTEVNMSFYGERSGFAPGHATFATQRSTPDVVTGCAESGDRTVPMDLTLSTQSPLVSSHAAGGSPSNGATSRSREARPRLRLSAQPRHARPGRRTLFRFKVTAGGRPIRDALIRFAGRRVHTRARGNARVAARLVRNHQALTSKRGYRMGRITVRVTHRARRSSRAARVGHIA